ncbi:MAG: hypothetical protein WCB27_24320 [Thermoguttaceae bacterium]|jgi:hypothetical protein
MSTRERWVVYPLLFLTLGIVMRDKFAPSGHFQANEVTAAKLRCGELQVDKAIAGGFAARDIQCRELLIAGPNGRPTVVAATDPKTKEGLIITLSAAGVPLIRLQPTDSGGVVFASDFRQVTGVVYEKPKTPATPTPKQRSKESEKAPAKAAK